MGILSNLSKTVSDAVKKVTTTAKKNANKSATKVKQTVKKKKDDQDLLNRLVKSYDKTYKDGTLVSLKKNTYGNELDLVNKYKNGDANDKEIRDYKIYQKLRQMYLPDFKDLDKNLKSYYERYKTLSNGYHSQEEYDKYIADGKDFKNKLETYWDYYTLYDEEGLKQFERYYDNYNKTISNVKKLKSTMSNFKNQDEFNGAIYASGIKTYKDLTDGWNKLEKSYNSASNESDKDDILKKMNWLNTYGFNQNVINSMTDEDWENERIRSNYAYNFMLNDKYNYMGLNFTALNNGITGDKKDVKLDPNSKFDWSNNENQTLKLEDYINPFPESKKPNVNPLKLEEKDKYINEAKKYRDSFYPNDIDSDVALYYTKISSYKLKDDFDDKSKSDKKLLNKINSNRDTGKISDFERKYWAVNAKDASELTGGKVDLNVRGKNGLPKATTATDSYTYTFMTDDEVKTFNYLYNTQGEKAAERYVDMLKKNQLNPKYLNYRANEAYKFGKEHPWLSLAFNALEKPGDAIASIWDNVANVMTGDEDNIDPYSLDNISYYTHGARIQGGADSFNSGFAKGAYKIGNTAAEQLGTILGSGGNGVLKGLLNASSTMENTTIDYKLKGASDGEAVGMGIINGLIEYGLEKYSWDNIVKTPDILTRSGTMKKLGAWGGKFAKDFGIEGGTEVLTNWATSLAAFLTDNREHDEFLSTYDELRKNGLSGSDAFFDTVKKMAPGYLEEFVAGGFAGGAFGSVDTYGNVKTASIIREDAGDYFSETDLTVENVQRLLIMEGLTDEAEIANVSNGIVEMGQGQKVDSAIEAKIKENPVYRGILHGYVDVYDIAQEVMTDSKDVDVSSTAPTGSTATSEKTSSAIPSVDKDLSGKALNMLSESNPDFASTREGRAGREVYLSEVTEGEGGLVDSLIKDGFSKEDALTVANQMYDFMYEQGYKGKDMDVAINAVSENIMPGYEKTAELFYTAGKIDAQNVMRGKKSAKVIHNDILKDMYKTGEISHKTVRAINAFSAKTGFDIEFVEEIEGGHNASFNTKTGVLQISRKSKKPFISAAIHETVHAIRSVDTGSYNKLRSIVYEVLSQNRDAYKGVWSEMYSLYKNEAADTDGRVNKDYISEEMTAEVVSQLLTDEAFVNEMAKTDRNFVQRIYDAIVDFFDKMMSRYTDAEKVGSADMDAAVKQLQTEFDNVKKMYKKALANTEVKRGVNMTLPKKGEVMHSDNVITTEDAKTIQSIGRKSINELTEDELAKLETIAQKYWNSMLEETRIKSPFFRRWFGDWREYDKTAVISVDLKNTTSAKKGTVMNNDSRFDINVSNVGIDHIQNHLHDSDFSKYIISHLDEITQNAILLDTEISEKSSKTKHDNTMLMHNFYSVVNYKGEKLIVKLFVEEFYNDWNKSIQRRDYDLSKIKTITDGNEVRENNLTPLDAFDDDSKIMVSDLFKLVKTYDKEFKPVKCSTVLNEDGTPKKVYHGTRSFGFRKFDTSESDDKSTLFFADSPELASTYSGKAGISRKKDIDNKNVSDMSNNELTEELNKVSDSDDESFDTHYELFTMLNRNDLIHDVNRDIEILKSDLENMTFNGEGMVRAAEHLKTALMNYNYSGISTPLYTLLHYSDSFRTSEKVDMYAELESNVRLMNKLIKAPAEPMIVAKELGGYAYDIYSIPEARELLETKRQKGIYEVYLNIKNPLIVNVRGNAWNNIREWSNALIPQMSELELVNEGNSYYLVNKTNDMRIPGAVVPATDAVERISENELMSLMRQEAINIWAIRTENAKKTRDVAKIAKQFGYDGVIFENIMDNGGMSHNTELDDMVSNVYVAFNSEQIKSTENKGTFSSWNDDIYLSKNDVKLSKSSVAEPSESIEPPMEQTAAERSAASFELKAEVRRKLNEHIEKYGTLEKGVNPVRDVDLPKKTADDRYVRRGARTVIESARVTDEVAQRLTEEVANGEFWTTYELSGDKKAQETAHKRLEHEGFDKMLSEWDAIVESDKKIDKQDMVNAQLLMEEAAKNGDTETVVKIVTDIAAEATRAGQIVQSMMMLKKLGAEANVYKIEQTVKKLQKDLDKKFGEKSPTLEIPKDLMEEYARVFESEDKEGNNDHSASDAIVDKIYEEIAKQIPSKWVDKLNAWRYFAMLGNPRTHIRNMAGNLAFMPAIFAKNLISATGEGTTAAVLKMFGRQMQRTKTVKGVIKATFKQGAYKYALNDASKIESILRGEEKYSAGDKIMQKVDVFKRAFVNKLVNSNSDALEWEDWFFLRRHYARALTMYMEANKLDGNTITDKQLEKARVYAIKEAQKATFRDASKLAATLSAISKQNKTLGFAVEAILPFKKTPINILKRGVEYSPVGIVGTIYKGIRDVKKGKFTASEFIDGLGANLTGTALLAVGVYLASEGILRGPGDDEEDNKFSALLGMQNYSLKIGDGTYTIDWLSPSAMSMFVGCEFWNAMDDGKLTFADIGDALPKITEPLFDMSMLDGLANIIETASYAQSTPEALASILFSIPTNYAGQLVPTLGGQIARTIDPVRRKTYIDKNSKVPQWLQSFAQQQAKKIPFLSKKLQPYVNAKGETEVNAEGNVFVRAIQNFFSPGYYKTIKSTAVDEEIMRLYESKGENAKNIIPQNMQKYITVDGERVNLSAEQYTTYQKTAGQMYYRKLKEVISSDYYKGLSDSDKVKLLEDVREYSIEYAKEKTLPEYHSDSSKLKTFMELDGGYQFVLSEKTDIQDEFDIVGNKYSEYEKAKTSTAKNIMSQFDIDISNAEFNSRYRDKVYEYAKEVNLEKYSDGKYKTDKEWIQIAMSLNDKERAEFIYGKTLTGQFDNIDDARETIYNDEKISGMVKMYVLSTSAAEKYSQYLNNYNVDPVTWLKVREAYDNTKTIEQNGEKVTKKQQVITMIDELDVSDVQKSAIYRALGYKDTRSDGKSNIDDIPWDYSFDNTVLETAKDENNDTVTTSGSKYVKTYSVKKDGDTKLSKDFYVKDFACKDGSDYLLVSSELVTLLQKIRNHFGKPITINSGYRNEKHNRDSDGERNSQHLYGTAADIVVHGVAPEEVARYAEQLMPNSGGVGRYSNFTHVDVRSSKARWIKH